MNDLQSVLNEDKTTSWESSECGKYLTPVQNSQNSGNTQKKFEETLSHFADVMHSVQT